MKTKTRFHKLTAWLLTIAMLMTFIPSFTLTASAAEPEYDGVIGELYYKNDDENGTTTIFGNGALTSGMWITEIYSNVVIEEGVTSIEATAFRGCSSLETLTVKGDITAIGNLAFQGCSSLTTLTFMGNVTAVGSNVFRNCDGLSTIYYHGTTEPESNSTLSDIMLYSQNGVSFCGLTPSGSSTPETPTTYTVTISDSIENGTVSGTGLYAEGDTVTLTVTPNEGFVLGAVSYYDGTNDLEITATDGVYSFTMPANEVMINAIFVEVHSVLTPRYAGYTINRTADTVLPIKHGDSYAFTVEITDGYEKTAEFAVKAGNREDDASALTALTPDGNGVYTITNITSDKKIQVVGVSPCKPDSIDDFKADGNAPFKLVCEADASHSITAPYFDSAYVTVGDINATTRLCEITYNVGKYLEDKLPGHRAEGYILNYITMQLRWDEEASKWAYASATRELTVTCGPETYDIRIASNSKGTVTSDKTEAAEGETVTITLVPAEGYAPGTVRVEDESGEDVPVTNSTFTMPASYVTVYATFVKSSTEVQFEVVKEINDWNAEGSFTFELQAVTEGAPMPTNASAVAKEDTPSVSFGTIVYDEIGTYEYTITEVQGSLLGMSYDPTPHTVIVTVTQGADYKLSATVTYDGEDQLIITNTYTPMHSVRISAVDIDDGFELEGATLQILDKNGYIIDEWVSTTEPHTVEALRVNETYTIQAAAAPSGYKKCSGVTFRMDATHGLVTYGSVTEDGVLLVEFAPVGFIIEAEPRFDAETRANIMFEICDAENEVVASRSLAEFDDWAWKVIGLPMGNDYTVRVTNAPWGYANPADTSVSIDRDGNVTINGTPSADGVIFVTFEEISPAIHEIVFNSDSDAYDAETNTFYYDSQHLPRIVINGQDLLGQKIYLGLENSDGNHLGFYDIAEDDTGIFMPLNKAILDETFDIFAMQDMTADIVKIRAEITGSPDAPTYLELNFKPKKYSITLDSNGANIEPVTLETDYRKLTALPTPERSGYTFNGWFDAQIGGNEITTDTVFTQDTTIYAQWTKLIPKITGIAVDITSPAYDAATDTFTVAKDKPFVVVLSGEHFVNIDDEFLEANAFGFVPSVVDSENAFGNALQVLKETGLATIDAEDNRIKLTFDYDTMKAFVVEHGGLEGICYGDIANIQEENIASVNIAFTKYDPVYTEPTVKTGLVYNGAEQELLIPGTAEGGTMKYYIGGTAATAEVPTRKAAGEYTVTCIIDGDSFHNNIVVGEYTVAIAKKTIDSAIVLTAPVKNTAPQTEVAGSGYTATVVWSPEVTDKFGYNTEYTATVTITPDENHTVAGIAANGYTVEGAKTVTNDENSNVVTVAYEKTGSRHSSGGGGGTNTSTTTTKNEDGSTTKVTENKTTGTKTEATTNTDGSTTTVETKKDGTVTTTEKDKDGNTTTTVEKSDGTSTTTEKNKDGSEKVTEKSADGTTVKTEKDTDGTKTVTTEKADGSTTTEEVRKDGTEVKTETTTDGETTAEVKADGKAEVTIPVPDTEKGQMVVVTDENGNNTYITEVETNDNGVAVTTDGNATVSVMSGNKKEFVDVHHVDHWSEKSVDFVHILGLMNGTSENHFSPDVHLTRAMLVTVLYRAEGEPEIINDKSFADVENGSYYEKAVAWAKANGIVNGTSATTFEPNVSITREQIAAIMHRYADFKGHDVQVGENTNILSYDDVHHVSEYAIGAMQYAVGSGLIKGKTESTLNPLDNATRAEAAAILERFIKAN